MVSTCGPDMQPYPVMERNGVDVHPVLSAQCVLEFRAAGPAAAPSRVVAFARCLEPRRGTAFPRDPGRRRARIFVHTHLIDGLSASIWRRARQSGVPVIHTAHDYHLLCPRAFLLTRDWRSAGSRRLGAELIAPGTCARRLMSISSSAPRNSCWTSISRRVCPRAAAPWFATAFPFRRDATRTCACRRSGARNGQRPRFVLLTRLTVEKGVHVVLRGDGVAAARRSTSNW